MKPVRCGLIALLLGGSSTLFADIVVYDQPSTQSDGLSSQNSPLTPYTAYDDFTLATTTEISGVSWFGVYFNPPAQGPITGFTLQFYADASGRPGTSLETITIAGNADETSLGNNLDGFPEYSYTAGISPSFIAMADAKYWLSIVPDLAFPPQWAWERGTGGDSIAFQNVSGSLISHSTDLAFSLTESTVGSVPEPSSLVLFGAVAVSIAVTARRRGRLTPPTW